ncbi:hypothetical protein GCM10009809_34360 [Isoptericola hypogeus]|uniref:Uncharacterized protein n=1 Tax=Isoptericola hypogeus TaxID=300179 RepID=A0ABP4VXM7_9MICO
MTAGAALVVAGCAGSHGPVDLGAVLAPGDATASYALLPDSVTDALPSTRHLVDGADLTFSDLAVSGRLTSWERGEARAWDTDAGRVVAWDGDADTRTLLVDLAVDGVVDARAGTAEPAGTVVIEVVVDAETPADAVADALVALDDVVVLLVPADEPAGYRIALDGALLADVGRDGSLTWPGLVARETGGSTALPAVDARTLRDLRDAAEHDVVVDHDA